MLGQIAGEGHRIDAVIVVRNGQLALEAYVYPFAPGQRHALFSCTKSVVSALIGIAIERGDLPGVDTPILDLLTGRDVAHLNAHKEAMALEHVLTMTTGLDCRDSYLYRWRGMREMERSDDWAGHVLDLPMVAPPGTRFEYCNGASFLLSAILHEATGESALAYAHTHLFDPLGISDVEWVTSPGGINLGYSELYMRPLDMARIGHLYLNGGRWGEAQVVPAEWVARSTRAHIDATLQDGYGYQWWIDDDGYYMALGYMGQFIYVVPEQQIVAVFVSQLRESDFTIPQQLLEQYILPAARSVKPLPANPEGTALLTERVRSLADPERVP